MIWGKNARLMLKYQKAKAKLVEYSIPEKEYPQFTLNSNELSYPTTYILSRYSECVIENRSDELDELKPLLNSAAQYYDSAFNSKDRRKYDLDFLLSGASAYFLNNDFGSAKVLAKKAYGEKIEILNPQKLLLEVYNYLLEGADLPYLKTENTFSGVYNYFLDYFATGKGLELLNASLRTYRNEIYEYGDPDNIFYVDILAAVIILACENSAWEILPQNSDILREDWRPYLQKRMSVKMLWPAQRLIAEKGLLRGENAIVQLPTGVGKTKSIEIIIRAAFLSGRAKTAIIVAPLRALCNEITSDMYRSFGKEVTVNQFSDVLQNDFWDLFSDDAKKQILICTPEKLSYVLHHAPDFLSFIDLFIFDEGHMFDDGGRGVTYELLITHIRQHITSGQQLILLSAVLPNAEAIKKWLFGDAGVLAADEKIVSTPKSVGFSSRRRNIYFFSDNKREEDYFIPQVLKTVTLEKLPRERNKREFPEVTSAFDVALYHAVKLCPNGGAAIYVSQQRSVKTVLERILDLDKRNYNLGPLKMNVENEELQKLKSFIEKYYGTTHYYTKAVELGVLPHSSNIQNGVKLAVEYALKKKFVFCVVCTSTLAQGVNIPIKYLLVTNVRVGQKIMKTRDFQNLIGRTARAGIYTEGSVIITDSRIFDERNNGKSGGKYLWDDCMNLFDARRSEPCSSSILSLVQRVKADYNHGIKGENFIKRIIEHLDEKEFFVHYANRLEQSFLEINPDRTQNTIIQEIMQRYGIVSQIENYLCLVISNNMSGEDDSESAADILKNTLAYALASDKEKELLEKVFLKIEENIKKYPTEQIRRYSNAMSGIERSSLIEQWITDEEITERIYSEDELLELIIGFYLQLNAVTKYDDKLLSICQQWIEGRTPEDISNKTGIDVSEADSICSKRISYELNFFIGNICDLVAVDEENMSQVDPRNILTILQKKVKYGVPSITAVSVCEKIFNDRWIAMEIVQILQDENIGTDRIVRMLKGHKEAVLNALDVYPGYFKDRMEFLLR